MDRLIVPLLTFLFLTGCTTTSQKPHELTTEPPPDLLSIVSYDPPLPAMLLVGERLFVTVNYTINSVEEANIWVRPFTHGENTFSCGSHPSPRYKKGSGQFIGWFESSRPTVVDEVRVRMVANRTNEVTVVAEKVQASWVDSRLPTPLEKSETKTDSSEYKVDLEFSTDLMKGGVSYSSNQSVKLSANSPPGDWHLPNMLGSFHSSLWGREKFGHSTVMNVVVHVPEDPNDHPWQIFTTFDGSTDFSKIPPVETGRSKNRQFAFSVDYADGTTTPYVIRVVPNALNADLRLMYHRECIRVGHVGLPTGTRKIILVDDDSDGIYSDLFQSSIIVDQNSDGHMTRQERVSAASPIDLEKSLFFEVEVPDNGSWILLRPSSYGVLEGVVTSQSTLAPIAGASVRISPYDFEAESDEKGRYRLRLPAGKYEGARITAQGYVPSHERRVPSIIPDGGSKFDISLAQANIPEFGQLTLSKGDSYHFLSGEHHKYVGGDFYYGVSDKEPTFWANNLYQGGVIDLGPIQIPLDSVTPPLSGYYRFGIPAKIGHVYVSPAKDGEDGCYIIFKVQDIAEDGSCNIDYLYLHSDGEE